MKELNQSWYMTNQRKMANEENLKPIPINTRSLEEQKRIQSKGGSVCSPRKKLAARLRELKKKGLTDEAAKRISEIFEEPEMSALDIFLYLEQIKKDCNTPYQKIQLSEKFIQLHKAHHGEKIKQESQNLNVNLNVDLVQFEKLAQKYSQNETKRQDNESIDAETADIQEE